MKVVVAPDKFAGTMTASEAAAAIVRGWTRARPHDEIVVVPMADGGEGLLDVVSAAVPCERRRATVTGPMGGSVEAAWLLLSDGRAVVEAAEAVGLRRVAPAERDPLRASSFGVGELVAAASHCREVVVGLGGSATVDGGSGMAMALGAVFSDARGGPLAPSPASLSSVAHATAVPRALPRVTVAVDVDNPLLGPHGAAVVFGPQKGADAPAVVALEAFLDRFAGVVERDLPGGPWRDVPGAGAAGGLGFGLLAFTRARLQSGAAAVAELLGLATAIRAADVVVTGEGSLDAQTLRGKAPDHVRRVARAAGVAVAAVAGRAEPRAAALFDSVAVLGDEGFVRPAPLVEDRAEELALSAPAWIGEARDR